MQPGKPITSSGPPHPSLSTPSLPITSGTPTNITHSSLPQSSDSTPSQPIPSQSYPSNTPAQPTQFAPPRNPSLSAVSASSPSASSPNTRPPPPQSRTTVRPTLNLAGLTGNSGIMDEAAIRAAALHMTPEQRDAFVGHQKAMMAAQRAQQAGTNQESTGQQPGSAHPPLRMNHITNTQQRPPGPSDMNGNGNGSYNLQATPAPIPSGQIRPPGQNPSQTTPNTAAAHNQRKQFVQTLFSYHKGIGQIPPPEILQGPVPGAIQMGQYTVELVDLFMTIMRQANGQAGVSLSLPFLIFFSLVEKILKLTKYR